MYCIKCEKNTVLPMTIMDMDGDHINEVEELWRVEKRNGKTLNINNKMINGGIIQIISADQILILFIYLVYLIKIIIFVSINNQ